jgi:hypothetical protein
MMPPSASSASPLDAMGSALASLFVAEPHDEYQRIRTPFLYPDGDNIDIFTREQGEGLTTVTDLGETLRWLRMQTLAPRRSPKQRALLEDAALTHGVELYKGMLMARCHPGDDLTATILRVAHAAIRVSDLWFTFRARSVQFVTDEVADFLQERDIPFDRGEKLTGRSGRIWSPDFHIRAPQRSSLVYVLSTGNRSAARSVAHQVVSAWFDLSQLTAGPEALRFVSLFDDTSDVWAEEDYRLVEQLSTVTRWSSPEEFEQALRAA